MLQKARASASIERRDESLIGGLIHQRIEFGGVGEHELQKPALSGRILIDEAGRLLQRVIDLDDLARRGRVDAARRLDAFDDGGLGALGDALAEKRQLDENDVAELRLGVIGDADDADVPFDLDVFMIVGVAVVAIGAAPGSHS